MQLGKSAFTRGALTADTTHSMLTALSQSPCDTSVERALQISLGAILARLERDPDLAPPDPPAVLLRPGVPTRGSVSLTKSAAFYEN